MPKCELEVKHYTDKEIPGKQNLQRKEQEFKPRNNSLIILVIPTENVQNCTYAYPTSKDSQREIFFIKEVEIDDISQETILRGHFLGEFEHSSSNTLTETDCTTRISFPEDSRIDGYDDPTKDETLEFIIRIHDLSRRKPQYSEAIENIIKSLGLPEIKIMDLTPLSPVLLKMDR